ncbi:hypothetical protein [Pseudoduganella aquatica]|uniref:GAF domain-containing protein n=1 Tax=Pseudoduganella aquatica TaxID=2660641 RepID=A0A7X4HER1_9BURK|nr:hypothetical protein [Pseudoduganella aquatica]MYN09871.1 hypothetical protein [Pseudoduganella aquatica]
MAAFRLSTASWKWLICTLSAVAALLLVMDASCAFRALALAQEQGTLGASLNDHIGLHPESQGTHRLQILQLDPGSPLLAFGAKAGDGVQFDRVQNRWRRFTVGEPVGLTLYQSGPQAQTKHLTVAAVASPVPFAESFDYAARLALAVPALLFTVLIGIKQGENRSQRALAMAFCVQNFTLYMTINYLPAGAALGLAKLVQLTAFPMLWYCGVLFALHYQQYPDTPLRRWLWRLLPLHRALCLATAAYALWFGLGNEAPLLLPCTGIVIALGVSLWMLSMVDGWRQSRGEMRQRHYWLLLSFLLGTIPPILVWVPALDGGYQGMRWTVMAMFAGQLLMYIGLAYSVLKHRVFHFEFAISRMLIFSVVSVLLLCVFGVVERISSSLLHGGGHADAPTVTLVLDGLIALAVYLAFHHMHGRVERWVERVFFHQWHDNEHKLQHYVKQAAHITTVDALLDSCRQAMDRFTSQAGCAIYLRQADGRYEPATAGTLAGAPDSMAADDSIAVALRAEMAPQLGGGGQLALPMSHRGTLYGFVLLGPKPNGESYRPDECTALDFAVRQIGLDLHALRVELLEREVQKLTEHTEQQGKELRLMAGRRQAPRHLSSVQGGAQA